MSHISRLKKFNALSIALSPDIAVNTQSLRESILQLDIQTVAKEVSAIFNSDASLADKKLGFLGYCRVRAHKMAGTALSYTAAPDHHSNLFILGMVKDLFSPKSLKELLEIISPETAHVIEFVIENEHNLGSTTAEIRQALKDKPLVTNEAPLANIAAQSLPDNLSDILLVNSHCLLVEDISGLSFRRHSEVYASLSARFPAFVPMVYQHNDDFRQLQLDILHVKHKGQTPKQAMESLRRRLIMGGTEVTGNESASSGAIKAYEQFKRYCINLPDPFRSQLMALSSVRGKKVASVLEDLDNGECVETAASQLGDILSANLHQALLDTLPQMTPEQMSAIESKYNHKQPPLQRTFNGAKPLPREYLQASFSKIKLEDVENFVQLLLSFQPALYADFLEHVRFDNARGGQLFAGLMTAVREGFFNTSQMAALSDDIVTIGQRFCGEGWLLGVLHTNNQRYIRVILDAMSPENRLKAVMAKTTDGSTVLHDAAHNSTSLKVLLDALPADQRVAAVTLKDGHGYSVLHKAAHDSISLQVIFEALPADQRLAAATAITNYGNTVLHDAAHNSTSLKVILDALPADQRVAAIKAKNNNGATVLFCAAFCYNNEQSVDYLLRLYATSSVSWRYSDAITPDIAKKLLAPTYNNQRSRLVLTHYNKASCTRTIHNFFSEHKKTATAAAAATAVAVLATVTANQ